MKQKKVLRFVPYLLIALMIVNIGISLEIERQKNNSEGICLIGGSCDIVTGSKFSSLFGIPTTFFGAFSFLIVLMLLIVFIKNKTSKNLISIALLLGTAAATFFILNQHFSIKAYCSLCLTVDFITIFSTILWFYFLKKNI
jgi:uncharacterized membrane protein